MSTQAVAMIGFGEAAQAFAEGLSLPAIAYDHKILMSNTRGVKLQEMAATGVEAAMSNADATKPSMLILSLVTADQTLAAAQETSAAIAEGALFCDMNSVAPDTKRAARQMVEAAGGRYVDVAVMAPVLPSRCHVPLLVSGPHAAQARAALREAGFGDVQIAAGDVGAASSVKMIRSVMIKGIEALSAECVLAAQAAGVVDLVIGSLDASWPGADWRRRFDYNLDRMIIHGERRAAEMEEVVITLDALGVGSTMTRGTVVRQRRLGELHVVPDSDLDAKLETLLPLVTGGAGTNP